MKKLSKNSRTHVPTPPILHNKCEISYPLHLLPPHCIQHTQVEYNCLLRFFFHLSTWRWPMKSAETCSCSLCNKCYTYLYHHIVVLDKYIQCNLVYYKHNWDDEPYDFTLFTPCIFIKLLSKYCSNNKHYIMILKSVYLKCCFHITR